MRPHEERVVAEKAELEEKRRKLVEFIGGDAFLILTPLDQELLLEQSHAMADYSDVLTRRIERFAQT